MVGPSPVVWCPWEKAKSEEDEWEEEVSVSEKLRVPAAEVEGG